MQIENEIDTNCNGDRILAAIRPAPAEHTVGPKFSFMSQILKHNSKKNFYMYIWIASFIWFTLRNRQIDWDRVCANAKT